MKYSKAVPFIGLLMFCFMLAAQSAKAGDIIFNDLGDIISVSPSSGPVTILGRTCQNGAANLDACAVTLSRAGLTITGVTGNFVLGSNSTYRLAEDPAKTLLSDTFTSLVLRGGIFPIVGFVSGAATFGFISDNPSAEGVPALCPASLCTATETGGPQEVGTITWSNGVIDHIIIESDVAPEPASLILFGSGLVIAGGFLRRRRQLVTPSV
jgi:hypothetical protein